MSKQTKSRVQVLVTDEELTLRRLRTKEVPQLSHGPVLHVPARVASRWMSAQHNFELGVDDGEWDKACDEIEPMLPSFYAIEEY